MMFNAPIEWSNVTAALEWLSERASTEDAEAYLLLDYAGGGLDHAGGGLLNVVRINNDPRRMTWLKAARAALQAKRRGLLLIETATTRLTR